MKFIKLDEQRKKEIVKYLQKNIYYFNREEVKEIESKGIISKEFLTQMLDKITYECRRTRYLLEPRDEFNAEIFETDEEFSTIPRSSDCDSTGFPIQGHIEQYDEMDIEQLYSFFEQCIEVNETYSKIYNVQNLRENAYTALNSIKSLKEHEIEVPEETKTGLIGIGHQLENILNKPETNIKELQTMLREYNREANEVWNNYLTNGKGQRYLVHNLIGGAFEGEFNGGRYMSTSLITEKTMGLYGEHIGKTFGFIIRPKKIISAADHDTFTVNNPESEQVDIYMHGKVIPLMMPWEIEEKTVQRTIEQSGEMLNYDNGPDYSEIVVDEYEVEAMYYRSNGEGELSPNYEIAKRMAEERGLELREIDISKAREMQGLEPMTEGMQRSFFCNILRRRFLNEEEISNFERNYFKSDEYTFIDQYYKVFYNKYLELRQRGEYSKNDILQVFEETINKEELKTMEDFYAKESAKNHAKDDSVVLEQTDNFTEENNGDGSKLNLQENKKRSGLFSKLKSFLLSFRKKSNQLQLPENTQTIDKPHKRENSWDLENWGIDKKQFMIEQTEKLKEYLEQSHTSEKSKIERDK